MNRILETVFANVNQWLHFAEAKNALLATLNGGAVLGLLALLNTEKPRLSSLLPSLWVAAICLVFGLLVCLLSFTPILAKTLERASEPRRINILYFGHLAAISPARFLTELRERYGTEEPVDGEGSEYHRDLADQIIANSRIALRKYRLFCVALVLDVLGVALCVVVATIIGIWF